MASADNHLIELLPRGARARLMALCEPVDLVLAEVLYEPGRAIRHVYFPTDGFVSLVLSIDGNPGLEIGMVGREGMVGALDWPWALRMRRCTRWCKVRAAPGALARRRSGANSPPARRCVAACTITCMC